MGQHAELKGQIKTLIHFVVLVKDIFKLCLCGISQIHQKS